MLPTLKICEICVKSKLAASLHCRLSGSCTHTDELPINKHGKLGVPKLVTPEFFRFLKTADEVLSNIDEIAAELELPKSFLELMLRMGGSSGPRPKGAHTIKKEALVYIEQNCGLKVKRRCRSKESNKPQFPVVDGYGAIDLRLARLRSKRGRSFWEFKVPVKSGVSFVFCLGFDNELKDAVALFAIPLTELARVSSIQVQADPIRGKWKRFKIHDF